MDWLAAASGAATALGWLPTGLAPLLPIALLLAMRGLREARTGREAIRFGLVFGAARYAVAAHFILALIAYSPLAVLFFVFAVGYIVPFAVAEAWGALWLERRVGLPRSLGLGILYATFEKIRTSGDLSFPADLLSHAFGTDPSWLSWEPWIGPFGTTLLIMATAALLDAAWQAWPRRGRAAWLAAGAIVLWLAPPAFDRVAPRGESGPALRVGIVQPAVTIDDKLQRDRWPAMESKLAALTLEAASGSDLVLWPESARPGPLVWDDARPFSDPAMERLAARAGVPILYGCEIARIHDGEILAVYNGAALVRPEGGGARWYAKQQLLPLAEGIPFARLFGRGPIPLHDHARERGYLTLLGNFSAGEEPTVFDVGPARIGVLICFEGFYPSLARTYRRAGANVLAVLTNDAWWGRSAFPWWHASMIATRAREVGVPVLRAANSGISSSVDRSGRTLGTSPLSKVTILHTSVHLAGDAPTFYTAAGDWPVWGALAFVGALAVRRRGARARRRARGRRLARIPDRAALSHRRVRLPMRRRPQRS